MERAILSSIIFEPETINNIQAKLVSNDFYLPFHQNVFSIILQLKEMEHPIDEEFIKTQLEKKDMFNEVYMLDLLSANPISNLDVYIQTIKDYSNKRKLKIRLMELMKIESPNQLLSELELLTNKSDDFSSAELFDSVDINTVIEKEPVFILENWLPFPKNALSMVVGKGGDGKSFLLIQAILRFCRDSPGKRALGWLSEDTVSISKFRATRIAKEILNTPIEEINGFEIIGSDSKSQPFHIVSGDKHLTIDEKWHRFKRQYRDYDLIILDPLIAFFGGEENSNSQARVFTTLLNSWASQENKTIIIIHHAGKSGEEVSQRGASAFRDAVRLNYTIAVDPDNDTHRLIHLEKDNWGIKLKLNLDKDKKMSRVIFPRALNFPITIHDENNIPTQTFSFQSFKQ